MVEISLIELELEIDLFQKEKSLETTGWPIGFFWKNFKVVGEIPFDGSGRIWESGESMRGTKLWFSCYDFKQICPKYFEEFKPISLCNLVYKIISKVNDIILKPVLYPTISCE